jgi:hypothetical protein
VKCLLKLGVLYFVFARNSVSVCDGTPVIFTEFFPGFLQYLQVNAKIVPRLGHNLFYFRIPSSVVLTDVSGERIASIFRVEGKIRKSAREASVRDVKSRLLS